MSSHRDEMAERIVLAARVVVAAWALDAHNGQMSEERILAEQKLADLVNADLEDDKWEG